jgi:tRNA1(Val) A37 N6-methylase TrmN6
MPINTAATDAGSAVSTLLLGGRVTLLQPAAGYRAGMDAALLAAAVAALPAARFLEAGCGVGGALLQAAIRRPDAQFVGVENDPGALDLARRNLALNAAEDRCAVVEGDVGAPFAALALEPFEAAFANPPFFDDETRLRAPRLEKRAAWFAADGLQAWTSFLLSALRGRGEVVVIHRADRLKDLLDALAPVAGSFHVRPVQSYAGEPAKRVIVRAQKHGRGPLVLLAPLVMHERGSDGSAQFTGPAQDILRGDQALGWR